MLSYTSLHPLKNRGEYHLYIVKIIQNNLKNFKFLFLTAKNLLSVLKLDFEMERCIIF